MQMQFAMRNSAVKQPVAVHMAHTMFGSVELVGTTMTFKRGAEIFGENEPSDYVYKLLRGSARSYQILSDGRRQIQGFHFAGDIFGLEAGAEHISAAEALTDVVVLMVRRSAVLNAAIHDGLVARELWTYTSRELDFAREHAMLLIKTAQERVASFLLHLADRFNGNAVDLPMSRQDIADYLGLTIETVSRTLSQFQDKACINLPSSRRVILQNRRALSEMNH
jgi:CRP-like cAMP-binding protein